MYNQKIMVWVFFYYKWEEGGRRWYYQIPESGAAWRQLGVDKPARGQPGPQRVGLFGSWKHCRSCYLRKKECRIPKSLPSSHHPISCAHYLSLAEADYAEQSLRRARNRSESQQGNDQHQHIS